MAEQSDDEQGQGGHSRREMIKRGAAVGGVLWAVPVIESFSNKAYAQVASPNVPLPPAGVGGISYVALLISCGGICTAVKVDPSGFLTCGLPGTVKTPCCSAMAGACTGSSPVCPPGLVVTPVGADGFLRVTLPTGCRLVDFRVHCGQCCDGPGAIGQPLLTGTVGGSFAFNQCSGVGNTNKPCSATGNQKVSCGGGGGSGGSGGGGGKKRSTVAEVVEDADMGHPAETHVEPA